MSLQGQRLAQMQAQSTPDIIPTKELEILNSLEKSIKNAVMMTVAGTICAKLLSLQIRQLVKSKLVLKPVIIGSVIASLLTVSMCVTYSKAVWEWGMTAMNYRRLMRNYGW